MLTPGRAQHSTRSSRLSTVSAKESTHSDQASQAAARMLIPALRTWIRGLPMGPVVLVAPPVPQSSSGPLSMEVPAIPRQGYHSTPRPTLIDTELYLVRLFTCRYSRDDSSSRP